MANDTSNGKKTTTRSAEKPLEFRKNGQLGKLFSGMRLQSTIRRNSKRSVKWMFNKIRNSGVKTTKKPVRGGMYCYVYDAKTKDILPYWDAVPLIILIDFTEDGFYGINFHYLKPKERLFMLSVIAGISNETTVKSGKFKPVEYEKLKKAAANIYGYCFKRYLFDHITSPLVPINMSEWAMAVNLPFSNFQKMSQKKVFQSR